MDEQEKIKERQEQPTTNRKAPALTRRQWILRLGETAALAGFSGVAAEELIAFDAQNSLARGTLALPPGLYEPSSDHMTHVLFRDERFITPPAGSETEYAQPLRNPFTPTFFSTDDFKIVGQLVRLMLNGQGSGASASGLTSVSSETVGDIAEWIDLMVSEAAMVRVAASRLSARHRALAVNYYSEEAVRQLETADPQATWREGLAWLKQETEKLSGDGFLGLTEAQQLELLSSVGDASREKKTESAGTHFYRLLKNQTIEGYYTSQAGLKELNYQGNAFHAESPGCSGR